MTVLKVAVGVALGLVIFTVVGTLFVVLAR
jgi:hypothetical protein